jgi:Tn3 transposase DDE domain
VVAELAKLGFANMLDFMRPGKDGDPHLDFSALTRDQAAALAEVTVDDFVDGRGEGARDVWGRGLFASADMMSLEATRYLWAARLDPRRRTCAVGTYAHVLDQWGILYDQPIVLNRAAGDISGAWLTSGIVTKPACSWLTITSPGPVSRCRKTRKPRRAGRSGSAAGLRVWSSLARLWGEQGRRAEAHASMTFPK